MGHFAGVVAPADGPALIDDKEQSPYFVPTLLKDAPLINGTRAKAERLGLPLVGKQRSASHMTTATAVCADLDGISDGQLGEVEDRLRDARATFVIFSTHSHGREDKPGNRCRLVAPVDTPLDATTYKQAAMGLNTSLLNSLADSSGFGLHQQQGVWATARERAHHAFRRMHKAGVLSMESLLAAAPMQPKVSRGSSAVREYADQLVDMDRVATALAWIDPNAYKSWIDTAIWLKAAYGDAAYPVWLAWSETAEEASRADNDGRYAPQCVWDGLGPRLQPEHGAGALFARARDAALATVTAASQTRVWGTKAREGLTYLRRFHSRLYHDLTGGRVA